MKSMIVSAVILGMTASTSFAGGVSGAVELTDAQMDAVNAGALVTVVDVVDIENNQVQVAIPVNAAVAIAALGAVAGAVATQPGRIGQRR
jgi:hypothetical protein